MEHGGGNAGPVPGNAPGGDIRRPLQPFFFPCSGEAAPHPPGEVGKLQFALLDGDPIQVRYQRITGEVRRTLHGWQLCLKPGDG